MYLHGTYFPQNTATLGKNGCFCNNCSCFLFQSLKQASFQNPASRRLLQAPRQFCMYVLDAGSHCSLQKFWEKLQTLISLLSPPALLCDPSYHRSQLLLRAESFALLVLLALGANLKWSSSFYNYSPIEHLTPFISTTRWSRSLPSFP